MNCHPILTHAIRHVRRRIIRHAHHAIAAVVAAGCVGTPVVVLMLPEPVARTAPADTPQPIPEPGGVGVLAVGVVGLVVWRRRLP